MPLPIALIPFHQVNSTTGAAIPLTSSMGERIIFNSSFGDPNPGNFRLEYTGLGGTFNTRSGPANLTLAAGLASGNRDFYISTTWRGQFVVSVQLLVRDLLTMAVATGPIGAGGAMAPLNFNWTFTYRASIPTKMAQVETEGERPLGSVYSYNLSGPKGTEWYGGQTVLERFLEPTCNIELSDLKPAYKTANGITTKSDIVRHFWPGPTNNGTFTIDENNQFFDVHGGGMPPYATFAPALLIQKPEIHLDKIQIYETQSRVMLGKYTIRRISKRSTGTLHVKKFKI